MKRTRKYKVKIKDRTEGVLYLEAENQNDAELQGLNIYKHNYGNLATYIQNHGELEVGSLSIVAKVNKTR